MLNLFDTYERKVRPFTPLTPPQVKLYACGLTVSGYARITDTPYGPKLKWSAADA